MLGVYTRVPVESAGQQVDVCIYHMIAPDLCAYADGTPTADLRALVEAAGSAVSTNDLLYAAARVHATAWYLAFAAAHEHGFTKLSDVLVGGGAFVPEDWHELFKVKVHDTALSISSATARRTLPFCVSLIHIRVAIAVTTSGITTRQRFLKRTAQRSI